MQGPRIDAELKRDTFGVVERVVAPLPGGGEARLIRRVVAGRYGAGLVALLLARREARALEHLAAAGFGGVAATPGIDGATLGAVRALPSPSGLSVRPGRVFVRPFAEGAPLHRAEALPLDFFDLLEGAVRELHALGVCHNDLHKEQNVVVGEDGRPILIDFQLATLHPRRRGRWFRARCADDLRHVQKHRRRYTRDGRGPAELRVADAERMPRRGIPLVWKHTGKPIYRFVTRRLLGTRDGEEHRPSSGPWPRWTDPVGPAIRCRTPG